MFSISQAQFLQYVRIAIQWAAATLGYSAFLNGSTGQMLMAGAIALATLAWTAYATRIAGKINDLVGAQVITPAVAEKMKDVAADPEKVVATVTAKPVDSVPATP